MAEIRAEPPSVNQKTRAEHAIVCRIFETSCWKNPLWLIDVAHRCSPLEKSVQRDSLHESKPQLSHSYATA